MQSWPTSPGRLRCAGRELGEGDTLAGDPVLPEFAIAVADLFAGVERDG